MGWTVYIIRCNDGTLYTGVTTELERRFQEHLSHPRGAKYFNGRKPLEVVYSENGHTRSSACQREAAIKKLSREEKLRLIAERLDAADEPTSQPRRETSAATAGQTVPPLENPVTEKLHDYGICSYKPDGANAGQHAHSLLGGTIGISK